MTKKNTDNIAKTEEVSIVEAPPFLGLFAQPNFSEEQKVPYHITGSYYIQLHVSNIYDCFMSGIITPSAYIENRTRNDIQSRFADHLLISKGYVNFYDTTQCLLEVVFKPEELLNEVLNDNIFLFNRPIPITRIKRIVVSDKQVKEKVINTALTQDVGRIPETLFSYFESVKYDKFDIIESDFLKQNEAKDLIQKQLIIFDKILGLFAFIKNQQLYYSQLTRIFSNYSEHFLEAFSIINNEIEIKFSKYIRPEFIKSFQKLFDFKNNEVSTPSSYLVNYLFSNALIDNAFLDKFFNLFSDTVQDKKNQLLDLKKTLQGSIGKKSALRPLLEISKIFYHVAYLYLYGKKGSNDKEILKNTLKEELDYNQSEFTLSLLGLYYGYKQLRPSETIRFEEYNLEKKLGTEYDVKFNLNTRLDYMLIESIYEFIFNQKIADKNILAFEPSVKENYGLVRELKKDSDIEIEFDIELFGVHLYRFKKQTDLDKITRLLLVFPEKLDSHLHVVSYIRKHYDKNFFLLRGASDIVFKNEFLKIISEDNLRFFNFEHFVACVELDKKYNLK
jgi:hypothetical protein